MQSFFVQPTSTLEDLRAQSFFLRNRGAGLSKSDIDAMTLDEMHDECRRLIAHITAENEQRAEASKAQPRASPRAGATHSGYKPH